MMLDRNSNRWGGSANLPLERLTSWCSKGILSLVLALCFTSSSLAQREPEVVPAERTNARDRRIVVTAEPERSRESGAFSHPQEVLGRADLPADDHRRDRGPESSSRADDLDIADPERDKSNNREGTTAIDTTSAADRPEELLGESDERFMPGDEAHRERFEAAYWYRGFADLYAERGGTYFRLVFASAQPCVPYLFLGKKEIGYTFHALEPPNPKLPDLPVKGHFKPLYFNNVEIIEAPIGLAPNYKKKMFHEVLVTGLKPGTKYYALVFAMDDEGSQNLKPLEIVFSTRSRGTVIDFWKIHVIEDGDGFSKGEGELAFQMFAKYKVANQKIISKTPRLEKDMSDGESWGIKEKAYVLGANTFQLFAGAYEEDGTVGLCKNGTGISPSTDFESKYCFDYASDGMTVKVKDKWKVINYQVTEGYKKNCVIKVDGRPHDVGLAFNVHATLEVMYWDLGLPWYSATNQDPWLK